MATHMVRRENIRRQVTQRAHVPPRVLIVDDDEGVALTFARILQLQGYDVDTALSADAGLRIAEGSHLDAIILDLRMPLLDGLGFLRRLRSREENLAVPAVVVTGDYFLDDTTVTQLHALGVDVRFKPLWLEDLLTVTRQLLETSHCES